MGCTSSSSFHASDLKVRETKAEGGQQKVEDRSPSKESSTPSDVSTAYSNPSTISSAKTCREELMSLSQLSLKERFEVESVSTCSTLSSMSRLRQSRRKESMHSEHFSLGEKFEHGEHSIAIGSFVTVCGTSKRGKVLKVLGQGHCIVKFDGHPHGVQVNVENLHVIPEHFSDQADSRPCYSLPGARLRK
jgi:hypothetical protein